MVNSDILLDDEGIELVPADGSVEVSTDPDGTPGIQLVPQTGAIRLGTDSSIVLASDEAFPPNQNDNTVFLTSVNGHGLLMLGRTEEDRARVVLDGPADSGGTVSVADYTGVPTVGLSGESGHITLGSGAASGGGIAGGLSLVDTDDTETITLDGATGAISATSLDVSEGLSVEGGLDLGNGMVLDVDDDGVLTVGDPANGQVGMRLDPATGTFSITDADGDPVFEVDTQAETVNISKSYNRGTIDGTQPGNP